MWEAIRLVEELEADNETLWFIFRKARKLPLEEAIKLEEKVSFALRKNTRMEAKLLDPKTPFIDVGSITSSVNKMSSYVDDLYSEIQTLYDKFHLVFTIHD